MPIDRRILVQLGWAGGRALAAAGLALGVVALLAAVAHVPPGKAIGALLSGAFGSPFAWSGTLVKSTPILLTGLSVAWAFRAGLFNIGAEGQLLLGAIAAAWVGSSLHLPGPLTAFLALTAGAAVGALAGGGTGALIGAGAGAAAGTAGAALSGKRNVQLPVESLLTFSLSQPVQVKMKR